MLNNDNVRMLAYIEEVTSVEHHPNADRLDIVHINGWQVICGRDDFKQGDKGVFFEVDSKLPEIEPFSSMEFLASKHFKIKTQKIRGEFSQGLFVPLWEFTDLFDIPNDLHADCTNIIGVKYAVMADNNRKNVSDKYKIMMNRRPDIFKYKWAKWMMKRTLGKKFMFLLFGKKKDSKTAFPTKFKYVKVTDEERIENIPWMLNDTSEWVKTTKLDGTSTTYILERKLFKDEFYVCSRRIRMLNEDQECYHDNNVYWENAKKYNILNFLKTCLALHPDWKYVCLQGESVGPNIQGNPHKLASVRFYGYNFIDSESGRWDSERAAALCDHYNIPWVPIVDTHYYLPKDMEEMKLDADGLCELAGAEGLREGYVYRDKTGSRSFKNVSREYLLKKKE